MRIVDDRYGEVVGNPDFFIRDGDGYLIRDCKLSRRFNEDDHPEIFRQMEMYGWLYERIFNERPKALQAYMGDGQLRDVTFNSSGTLNVLDKIQSFKNLAEEPYDPIGWSKCADCGYSEFCWSRARERHDVSMLPSVDQALAHALNAAEINNYEDLLHRLSEVALSKIRKRVGSGEREVGKAAGRILREAEAFISGEIISLKPLRVQKTPTLATLDVEGIPPHLDYSEKTYLWGLKVFGERPRPYSAAMADLGDGGDERGWRRFLENCSAIFDNYGDISILHWSHHEHTQVKKYVGKYGDPHGLAARIIANMYDLLPVVQEALVLPIPSYGLKLVERLPGYVRTMPEVNGKWSMATYIEAVETEDRAKAESLIDQIIKYNEEDADALWAVYCWLSGLPVRAAPNDGESLAQ
jgi:predicted RecB family nuclease